MSRRSERGDMVFVRAGEEAVGELLMICVVWCGLVSVGWDQEEGGRGRRCTVL